MPSHSYTEEQMNSIVVAHREAKTWSDKVALTMVRILRWGMDFCTGYSHNDANPAATKDKKKHWTGHFSPMDERKWLIRIVFLESVAGVPGMVAGMLRHFHSLRRLERDNGWFVSHHSLAAKPRSNDTDSCVSSRRIETLLEEAYNERMHLLTFLTLAKPGIFMRLMLLGAQGVFFNALVASYLVSPRTCHRFVGYLEEEAVLTYSRCIEAIDAGALPMFKTSPAPEIAIKYWNMPEGKRTLRDLMLYVRADEAKHREVNHTLGNLQQRGDPNPFVSEYKEGAKDELKVKHPGKGIENIKATGWEREEVL